MARNYTKETEWSKKKYRSFSARIDKETGDEFVKALEDAGISYAEWLQEEMAKYIKKSGGRNDIQ